MNLDSGLTENFIAGVEGKKNSSVIFLDNGTGDGEPSPVLHSGCDLGMQKNLDIASLSNDLFFVLHTAYCRLCGKDSLEDTKNPDFTRVCRLGFSFKIDFEQALAFRKLRGEYLREYQFSPLKVEVYI